MSLITVVVMATCKNAAQRQLGFVRLSILTLTFMVLGHVLPKAAPLSWAQTGSGVPTSLLLSLSLSLEGQYQGKASRG